MVADRLSLGDLNPHFFAYGSFPFYLLWGVAKLLGLAWPFLEHYDGLFLVGRCISAVFGLICAIFIYKLANKVFENKFISFLATTFLLFNVFHIQLSRFYAFDGVLTTLCIGTILGIVSLTRVESTWKSYLVTGIFLGLSVATKISALSLLLPFGVAIVLRNFQERKILTIKTAINCIFLLLIALIFFTIAEPYAWLDWKTFIANNHEQISMVKGEWRPPYTVQYEHTTPYIYPIEQMLRYTIGWPVGVLGLIGIITGIIRQFRKINPKECVILIWFLATFFLIAGYKVKFPRYLLPLYPIIFIYAARCLFDIKEFISNRLHKKNLAMTAVAVMVFSSLIHAMAFVSIYSTEHAYYLASRWIFENIPAGSRLLEGHWDDTLPLHLPGLDPARFKHEGKESELPLYEADTLQKLDIVTELTSKADYLIFPTQRLTGSIPRIPEEQLNTTNYLKLLFSENLGFKLEKSFKIRPNFGFFSINDDLADESLSVYDHPKVTIFKNVEHLSAATLKSRILAAPEYEPLPSREALMLKDADSPWEQASQEDSAVFALLIWIVLIEGLALLVFPFISKACKKYPDRGYALSKTAGVFIFGYFAWLFPALQIANASQLTCVMLVAGIALISLKTFPIKEWATRGLLPQMKYIIRGEILFWSIFILFLAIRAFNPEIFWGEKPMDFTFLNYFLRSEHLPPEDPWAVGNNMRYYYLGYYIIAALLKLSGISSAIGYNLAIATLPALCVASFYSLFLYVTRKRLLAAIGALSAVLLSNIELLNLVFLKGSKLNFDTFWASTRLFESHGFTEYPVWSFLFADLHAHVISLAFVALFLALSVELLREIPRPRDFGYWIHRVLYSIALGSLMAFNTWDFLVYGALTVALLIMQKRPSSSDKWQIKLLKNIWEFIQELALIGVISWFAASPYMIATQPSNGASWGWNHAFEYNSAETVLRHFGHWFAIIFIGFIFVTQRKSHTSEAISLSSLMLSVLISSFPIALGVASSLHGASPAPWGMLTLCSLLIEISLLAIILAGRISLAVKFGFTCCSIATFFLSLSEIFFLIDRMNTVFKFYLAIWFLYATAAASLSLYIFSSLNSLKGVFSRLFFGLMQVLAICFILSCTAGSLLSMYMTVSYQRIEGPRPTLDGLAYLKQNNSDEYNLVSWIRRNISGTAHLLEAQGDSYREFSRITMYTGLPILLGWEYHTKQRGTSDIDIEKRKNAVTTIYSSDSADQAEQILNQYNIDLIVVGKVERQTYPPNGIKKFIENPHLFPVLFKSGDTLLFTRSRSLLSTSESGKLSLDWQNR